MTDIIVRKSGRAGHITLNRPTALNALTWDMCLAIEAALEAWRHDPEITLVMIDGTGERAFCSGGDIAEMYAAGTRGDLEYGRRFWRDEYRLNAKIYNYNKPVVTFLHGFTMGGGVGVGCHASHRIVCENSQIAMPECSIGLIPDVGGTLILALAPGRCGEYLGLSGDRMDTGDALYAGFADHYVPQSDWATLKKALLAGDIAAIDAAKRPAPTARLAAWQADIDRFFSGGDWAQTTHTAIDDATPAIVHILPKLTANAPLAMAVAAQNIAAVRADPSITNALDLEFRFTYRCVAQGDFIEGIRAALIDRDRTPRWQHASLAYVAADDIAVMSQDLGTEALELEETV